MPLRKSRQGWAMPVLLVSLSLPMTPALADDGYTREIWLKHSDAANIIRVLNIAVPNPSGKRVMGGQGKHLVVTDVAEGHADILELLPAIDQPTAETNPDKVFMEMVQRGMRYWQQKKRGGTASSKGANAPAAAAAANGSGEGGARSFDAHRSTFSVYAMEDAQLTKKPRIIEDEGGLPSLSDLTLKGIFQSASGAPVALLANGAIIYTARDGSLFERNNLRVKAVTSKVLKDRVILVGPDRIPREIKFKSSL